jgi:CDP-diacylglycerol---serine O-phosphatidyltransferase
LSYLGKVGWLASFIYTAAVALRLARFNTGVTVHDKRYFQGLPSPAGAAIIAGFVWVCVEYELTGMLVRSIALLLTPLVGLLMVSNIRYRSFKDLDLKGHVPFMVILLVVFLLVLVAIDPPHILFLIFLVYGLSGPITRLWHTYRKYRIRKQRQKDNLNTQSH